MITLASLLLLWPSQSYANERVKELDDLSLETTNLPASKDIDFIDIAQSEGKDGSLIFTLCNEGRYNVSNWSVAFNAAFTVKNIIGAEIVSEKEVVQFKNLAKAETIKPGECIEVKLETDDGVRDIDFFRVYGDCDELSDDYASNDTIAYDMETRKTTLMLDDGTEDIYPEEESQDYESQQVETNLIGNDDSAFSNYAAIHGDPRTIVRNVNLYPYSCIAYLQTYLGRVNSGTGFMIGQRHMLTAAHCIYSLKNREYATWVSAIFGKENNRYEKFRDAVGWRMSSCYRSNPRPANDWACLFFKGKMGRGWLELNSSAGLLNNSITLTGYSGMGNNAVMYSDRGRITYLGVFSFNTNAGAGPGQSGSPVYNLNNKVYGIVSTGNIYGSSVAKARSSACRLTWKRVNYFKQKRWCGVGRSGY